MRVYLSKVMLSAGEERQVKTWRPRFLRQGSYEGDRNEEVECSRGRRSPGVRFLDFNPAPFPRGEGIFVLA